MTEVEEKLWLENIQLRQQAHYYQSLHARALAKQQEQADQIEVLKAKVAELQKRLFGRKRERGCSSEAWRAKRGPRRGRGQQRGTRGHGRQPRTTLPREEVVVQAPEGQRICPHCGLPFEAAGTQGAHEEIQWEVRLVRKGYRCQRYRRTCDCPGGPDRIVAAPPARLIPKGLLSVGTIVEMLRLKYKYHLPLQRILGLAQDSGLKLSPGTVCGIWQKLGPLLSPLYLAILEATRQSSQWLAQVSRQLPNQWQKRYGYCPVWLESLVEKDRFEGACYKAANWQCLGLTKGHGKLEKTGQPALPVKWVFVYPLCADSIARLNG